MECWCGGTKDSLYYFYAAVISKGYSSPFNQGCKRDFERDEGSATNRISSCCCSPHKPILLPNHKCELPLHFQLSIDTHSYTFYLSQVSIILERGRTLSDFTQNMAIFAPLFATKLTSHFGSFPIKLWFCLTFILLLEV